MLKSKGREKMENNFKEWFQLVLYLGGIIYYAITEFKKFKMQKFVCKRNIVYFMMGAGGTTFGLILIAYVICCLMFASIIKNYLLTLFGLACIMIQISGCLYFTSFINEAEYRQDDKRGQDLKEYKSWKRKRYFFGFSSVILCILAFLYFLSA